VGVFTFPPDKPLALVKCMTVMIANYSGSRLAAKKSSPLTSEDESMTQIRLRLFMPQLYQREPIISHLISNYGLVANLTAALIGNDIGGYFDLELQGTVKQIERGLSYLTSLNLKITGKPNVAGDGWYC
jgi:L-aspartate semialdehyde sulfurtransferase ferredoxin